MEKDADGRPLQLIGTNTDSTKRKKAELALQASESMLHSVFQAVPLAIAITSASRVLESINEGMVTMFGYTQDEVIGRNSRFLYFTDAEYEYVRDQLYRKDRRRDLTIEVCMRRKNGTKIQVLLSASLLEPDDPAGGGRLSR